ncbi:MAG: hypothetical protein RL757_2060 [Bacteroidota bacterium]|jgi:hypothetical protein
MLKDFEKNLKNASKNRFILGGGIFDAFLMDTFFL